MMPGRGPAPKPPDQRRRRNITVAPVVVAADGEKHGPELPEGYDWPQETLDWWDTWRRSAQAATFTGTDWSFLTDTALLHADFHLGDRRVAGELRLRVAKFGATPEDRARLRIEVGAGANQSTTRLRPKAAREARLLKAVRDTNADARTFHLSDPGAGAGLAD
jgi:hypothetical protein